LVYKEGYFTLEKERVFRHHLASYLIGMTETSSLTIPAYAEEVVQVWAKSVCNEGYFTLETERDFRHYLACQEGRGVTQTSILALHTHAPQAVEVCWKLVFNKGH
jgi:hypothetical protein